MLTCYAHTLPGLEQVCWLEIRARFPAAQFREFVYAKDEYGGVVFDFSGRLEALSELRTTERLFLAALWEPGLSRGRRDLRLLSEKLTRTGDLGRVLNTLARLRRRSFGSYRVVAQKYGRHQYRLRDWSQMVRNAVSSIYPAWTGVAQDADVDIWATIFGSQALVGVPLPMPPPPAVPPPYPRALAAGLVVLTEPDEQQVFLDPLAADGGLVLAERLAAAGAVAVWRGEGLLPAGSVPAVRRRREVTVHVWQDGRLDVADGAVDRMAAILPAGMPTDALRTLLAEINRLLAPQGKAVLFSHDYEQVKELLREQPALQPRSGYSQQENNSRRRINILDS